MLIKQQAASEPSKAQLSPFSNTTRVLFFMRFFPLSPCDVLRVDRDVSPSAENIVLQHNKKKLTFH